MALDLNLASTYRLANIGLVSELIRSKSRSRIICRARATICRSESKQLLDPKLEHHYSDLTLWNAWVCSAPAGVYLLPSDPLDPDYERDLRWAWIDPGAFALIGSGAFMGGVTRLTISLAVIMMEVRVLSASISSLV